MGLTYFFHQRTAIKLILETFSGRCCENEKKMMSKRIKAIPIQQSGTNVVVLVTSTVDKLLHEKIINKFMLYTYIIMILTWC